MPPWRTVCALFAAACCAVSAARAQAPEETKRIVVVPPLQWDNTLANFRPGYRQTQTDFVVLTGGIAFGMKPNEVNALLPEPLAGVAWQTMPLATEFPEDVKYFWVRPPAGKPLGAGIESCVGEASYAVFLFRARGLFRISYRLVPDAACPSVADAAGAALAYYARIEPGVALSMHYRNGTTEVVDVVDPGAGYLVPIRWQARRRR
jgi:hypothetical protein